MRIRDRKYELQLFPIVGATDSKRDPIYGIRFCSYLDRGICIVLGINDLPFLYDSQAYTVSANGSVVPPRWQIHKDLGGFHFGQVCPDGMPPLEHGEELSNLWQIRCAIFFTSGEEPDDTLTFKLDPHHQLYQLRPPEHHPTHAI